MTRTTRTFLLAPALALALALTAGACSSSAKSTSSPAPTTTTRPAINPADFSATVDNPWFPLQPGSRRVYTGIADGKQVRNVITVTGDTKTVNGVSTRVIQDDVYLDRRLEETTHDYYAQDNEGTVWYFGEDTATLDAHGNVKSTEGTWHAGVDGAAPGVFMEARPVVGHSFQQEYLKGHAEDHYKVLSVSSSVKVPYGDFHDTVLTKEWTPLEPGVVEHKYYARGIGEVRALIVKGPVEHSELVEFTKP